MLLQKKVDLNTLINHHIKLPSLFLGFLVLGSPQSNPYRET